jgi:hypothetical protein
VARWRHLSGCAAAWKGFGVILPARPAAADPLGYSILREEQKPPDDYIFIESLTQLSMGESGFSTGSEKEA